MSSTLFTVFFAVFTAGATISMLAILVGFCMDGAKWRGRHTTGRWAGLRRFCLAPANSRNRRPNSCRSGRSKSYLRKGESW